MEARQELFGGDSKEFKDELKHHYEVEDGDALHRILGQQYHAVVGNPPYIAIEDRALKAAYRQQYSSCHGRWVLTVPFMERFWDLALKGDGKPSGSDAGFIGQITGNSFMKREFGKKLIEEFLKRWDLTHVIDSAGAYIPGHGTPTVILFGKNQPPVSATIRTVLGICGEPVTPADPAQGLVWQAISRQIDESGSESEWVSSSDSPRANFHSHPWSIGGGGAAELKEEIEDCCQQALASFTSEIGIAAVTGEDDLYVFPNREDLLRRGIEKTRSLVTRDLVRDWQAENVPEAIWLYDAELSLIKLGELPNTSRFIWSYRASISKRRRFGTPMIERGLTWYEWQELYAAKLRTQLTITWGEIATHNNFILYCGDAVFKNTAPVMKLKADATEADHLGLLGVLNSSVSGFWLRQVCFPKGGSGIGRGIQSESWEGRHAFDSTKISSIPIPAFQPSQLSTALVEGSKSLSRLSPSATLLSWNSAKGAPLRTWLTSARLGSKAQRQFNIAWQEELDWQVYEAYGLIEASDCEMA